MRKSTSLFLVFPGNYKKLFLFGKFGEDWSLDRRVF